MQIQTILNDRSRMTPVKIRIIGEVRAEKDVRFRMGDVIEARYDANFRVWIWDTWLRPVAVMRGTFVPMNVSAEVMQQLIG